MFVAVGEELVEGAINVDDGGHGSWWANWWPHPVEYRLYCFSANAVHFDVCRFPDQLGEARFSKFPCC